MTFVFIDFMNEGAVSWRLLLCSEIVSCHKKHSMTSAIAHFGFWNLSGTARNFRKCACIFCLEYVIFIIGGLCKIQTCGRFILVRQVSLF